MLMLRYRPRSMTSKQPKMADHATLTSPTQDHTIPVSPFLGSPTIFKGFLPKGENEPQLSPTSILDSKPLFSLGTPIWYDNLIMPKSPNTFPGNKQFRWENLESKDIGLAVISSPNDVRSQQISDKGSIRLVMFGSQLKVQIPSGPPSQIISPKSPTSSWITTRDSKVFGSSNSSLNNKDCPKISSIFEIGDCCSDVESLPKLNKKYKDSYSFTNTWLNSGSSESFLSFCFTCKRKLGQDRDIYIYKGEKSFCTRACRCQEMLLDGVENSESDDAF